MKITEQGITYQVTTQGRTVVQEKADPILQHDAPSSVPVGSVVEVALRLVDFDGEPRADNGELSLLVGGHPVSLDLIAGQSTMVLELLDAGEVVIELAEPFVSDCVMPRIAIEVTS